MNRGREASAVSHPHSVLLIYHMYEKKAIV